MTRSIAGGYRELSIWGGEGDVTAAGGSGSLVGIALLLLAVHEGRFPCKARWLARTSLINHKRWASPHMGWESETHPSVRAEIAMYADTPHGNVGKWVAEWLTQVFLPILGGHFVLPKKCGVSKVGISKKVWSSGKYRFFV